MSDTAVSYDRYFLHWMQTNNYSFIITSYSSNKVMCIGSDDDDKISIWETNLARPMGLGYNYKTSALYVTNMGHLFRYENKGPEVDPDHGNFDVNYYPQMCYIGGDVDIHDVRPAGEKVYYCSALFNCVCEPSVTKTFDLYWTPPWIKYTDRLPGEDRCHLNGLCCVDDKPRYVTCVGQGNVVGSWKSTIDNGVVYDIVADRKVCEGLISPHSPKWYQGKLWILETGTGNLGYIQDDKFIAKKFLPGFLRGLDFVDHYAVVCSSLDRHDTSFDKIPLGDILKKAGVESMCGLFVVDLNTFDTVHELKFTSGPRELYDIVCLKNVRRPKIINVNESRLLSTFHHQ